MAKATVEHTTIRNQKLFCLNCGGSHPLKFPMPISDMPKKVTAFNELHKDCEKTWTEPTADLSTNVESRAAWWFINGERGNSSEFMWSVFTGTSKKDVCYPHDPADFNRCYKLLQAIPEWKTRLKELKRYGLQWSNLVDNWDKLTEMFEQNVKEYWKNVDKIGMHVLMNKCIKP